MTGDKLLDVNNDIKDLQGKIDAYNYAMTHLKEERDKLNEDKRRTARISLRWMNFESTISPAKDLSIA